MSKVQALYMHYYLCLKNSYDAMASRDFSDLILSHSKTFLFAHFYSIRLYLADINGFFEGFIRGRGAKNTPKD